MAVIIQLRHDTASNWTTNNPILAVGEAGIETDTNRIKVGNGVARWNSLAYFGGSVQSVNGKTGEVILDAADVGALPDSTVIPTVNNGVLTIQVNGTDVQTFGANQSTNVTANIEVPDSATWGNITGTLSDQTDLQNALNGKQDELTQGTGIDITSNTISNSGVRSVSTGATNGTISVNTGGTNAEVSVYGLGTAAYTSSTDYATSAQGTKADSAVQDVQVNGTSVTTSGVANIPKASSNTLGTIMIGSGLAIQNSGSVYIVAATESNLINKLNSSNPVVSTNLNIAMREGLGNNNLTWSDTYKTNARNTIGAEAQSTIQALSATDSITLADNTIYNGGTQTALTITLPSTADVSFLCEIDFTSGTTATTLTYSNTIKWAGDDVNNNVFLPVASKRYTIICAYDGVNYRFTVKGVE